LDWILTNQSKVH